MIGKVLANRYRMDERIGGGGMALVYRARDLQLGRDVAVKVLRGQFGSDEEFIRRFKREAQNAASLSNPHVVQIYDVGHDDEQDFIVMELVEGSTLKALIQSQGPLPIQEAVRIASQILSALEHAHSSKIVHRDIKPHNILIARDGRAKVTDFGIARATTTDTVTHTGSIMGSAHYFSPEQANGLPTGEKSDIYSMGIVLYEMLTGGVPFQGDSPITVALKHIRDRVVPPSQLNSEVPVELNQIVLQALEKDPEDRYASAEAMRKALVQFAEDHVAGRTHMPSGDFPTMDLRAMKGRKARRLIEEADDGEAEERESPSRVWIWVAAVALIVVGAVAFGVYSLVRFLEVPTVGVPELPGMHLTQAQDELKRLKLTSTVQMQHNNDVLRDHVIRTDPAPETPVKQGRDITLYVSRGPDEKPVPDVRNRSLDEARATLESDRFKVGQINYRTHATVTEGFVIEMTPAPLTPLPVGSTINLIVSTGPLKVPSIVDLPLNEARQKLTAAGLRAGRIDYIPDAFKAKDTVLSSDPAPGQTVSPGAEVNLTLAQGPVAGATPFTKEITVPGDAGQWKEIRIEQVDLATGATAVIFNEKRQAGTKFTVTGSFTGQAALKVVVDGQEQTRIPLP